VAVGLNGDAFEIQVTLSRAEAERKYFGVRLFAGENRQGLPINIQPANGTLQVDTAEAPFPSPTFRQARTSNCESSLTSISSKCL